MQTKKAALALVLIGALAAAAPALAYGPGPGTGSGMGFGPGMLEPAIHAERVQTRLDALKSALKLQPAQIDAWNAYEAKVKAATQTRTQLRQSMYESRTDPQALADQRVTMMRHSAEAADEINQSRKSLYASLNEEQQTAFDRFSPGPRFARGPADGPPGFAPGYRRGGRGYGFGHGSCSGRV